MFRSFSYSSDLSTSPTEVLHATRLAGDFGDHPDRPDRQRFARRRPCVAGPREDPRSDLEVRLWPVHRAPRTLHLRGALGGDARGSKVLLPGRRRSPGVGDAVSEADLVGRRRLSLRAARAVAVDDRRRQEGRDDGPRAAVHRRAHARDRRDPARQRDRPGASRARARAAIRGSRRARRRERDGPRPRRAHLGNRRVGPREPRRERANAGVRDQHAHLHRPGLHRQRAPRDRGLRHGPVPDRSGVLDAGRQRPGLARRHPRAAQGARLPGLPLAGRKLRERLRLEGRHRRPRPSPAAQEPGLEGHRAERRRDRRVHGALP